MPGAHEGAGLGNAFLSHIGHVDGIYHMVRVFADPDILHTEVLLVFPSNRKQINFSGRIGPN